MKGVCLKLLTFPNGSQTVIPVDRASTSSVLFYPASTLCPGLVRHHPTNHHHFTVLNNSVLVTYLFSPLLRLKVQLSTS